jgi:CTP synthase (UTP-ammonia lyase)
LRIGLVGAESDHRHVYPAALVALGDAGDAEGIDIDVRFVRPLALRPQDVDAVLEDVDGLLLPGGSDMANVPGQILMAAGALRRRTPTIGLCLGMQTMTTAVAQSALGSEDANLAEADPSAPIKTFTPLSEEPSLPPHRLGEKKVVVVEGSRLGDILGAAMSVRCNHRFRLNPELGPVLRAAGLVVSAHDASGQIADAIELAGHPFYFGLQGHPELSGRSDAPHPLIRAFVQVCSQNTRIRY